MPRCFLKHSGQIIQKSWFRKPIQVFALHFLTSDKFRKSLNLVIRAGDNILHIVKAGSLLLWFSCGKIARRQRLRKMAELCHFESEFWSEKTALASIILNLKWFFQRIFHKFKEVFKKLGVFGQLWSYTRPIVCKNLCYFT